jgi:hypothetical protein
MTLLSHTRSRRAFLIATAALAAGARATCAQTPTALPAFVDRLGELLALVPDGLVGATDESISAYTYADLGSQRASLGLDAPVGDNLPEGFLAGVESLPLSHNAFSFALTTEWSDTFGFAPLEIDRMLVAGEPPNAISIFAGVDTERVRAALLAAGYTEVLQETGGSYLTFGDDFDPSTSVGRLGVGSMNQAMIGQGLVVFTRDEGTLQQVTQVAAGLAPSTLETGGWPALMATFSADTVGVMALLPGMFARSGDASAMRQAAFGVRAGATSIDIWEADDAGTELPEPTSIADVPETRARVEVRIRYADVETAASEAEAIPERWESMTSVMNERPLTELMLVQSAGVAENDPTVAAIDFRVKGPGGWWRQLVERADLAAFVPEGRDEQEAPDATPTT